MAAPKIEAVVLKGFRDKRTKEIHEAGSVIEVTQRRFAEINRKDPTIIAKKEPEQED